MIIVSIVAGLGAMTLFYWASNEVSGEPKTFYIGLAGFILMIVAIVSTPPIAQEIGCFIDWDGRSNSTVCN